MTKKGDNVLTKQNAERKSTQDPGLPNDILNMIFVDLASERSEKLLLILPLVSKQWKDVIDNGQSWSAYVSHEARLKDLASAPGKNIQQALSKIRPIQRKKAKLTRKIRAFETLTQPSTQFQYAPCPYDAGPGCYLMFGLFKGSRHRKKIRKLDRKIDDLINTNKPDEFESIIPVSRQ